MLVLSILVVSLTLLLTIRADGKVAFAALPSVALPESCVSKRCFDVRCPGCGLTRSFIRLSQGDWRGSMAQHRLGWVLATSVALQIPYRSLALLRPKSRWGREGWLNWIGVVLIGLLIGNWLLETVVSLR
jgi:hypothetical protein